ncbi:MAG: hypothetical protein BM557_03600 [Flavobacterium sp. MedPE-SWcel]|uniref:hypothetical protein n=1 Tax=uncultured Flavobacterium sp. TaxID=165435 RepID=UPI0009151D71|nr:hypothetical protein [uncultured Flavobacterium sp.]OIQ21490.1 MAG: hypothetical protein BM557_03600 [Flavobacterium sp. MedPE-SWcel]
MIITSKYLIPKGYAAVALFPFIILRGNKFKENKILINHEKIHLQQQAELLLLPFYIWYIVEFLILLIKYKNRKKAYRAISFEKEAYTHESNLEYLNNRFRWNFIKHLQGK